MRALGRYDQTTAQIVVYLSCRDPGTLRRIFYIALFLLTCLNIWNITSTAINASNKNAFYVTDMQTTDMFVKNECLLSRILFRVLYIPAATLHDFRLQTFNMNRPEYDSINQQILFCIFLKIFVCFSIIYFIQNIRSSRK